MSPEHKETSNYSNGDIPREQRTTLVAVGFPRDKQKQDIVDEAQALLQERGFEANDAYRPLNAHPFREGQVQ